MTFRHCVNTAIAKRQTGTCLRRKARKQTTRKAVSWRFTLETKEPNSMMKKYLLGIAAAALLATPVLADGTKMISVNLSGVVKQASSGAQTSIISVGTVDLIAFKNRVDVYVPSSNSKVTALTVTVPLATITDMVFVAPSFLTVQGGGAFAVTIDYSTVPPTIMPPVNL